MKYAIISTDANPEYFSLVPLACYSWNKLGYRPVVLTIGDVPEVIKSFCDADFMPLRQTPLVKDSTIAQLYRLFACQSPMFGDNDIIVTSDSDMIIAKDIFNCNDGFTNYGYDLTGKSELPICYNIATAAKWRELMGEFHIPDAAYSEQWETYWSTDQQLLTQRAHQYGMGRITFVDRGNQNKHGLPTGRWDRHDWAHIPESIIDVHMKRNDWEAQIEVAERLWPGEDHSFITKFREALNGTVR
jgi:hypothetical protein